VSHHPKHTVRSLVLAALALALGGCTYVTIQASQLNAVRALFPGKAAVDFAPFTWRLRWAGEEQPVVPVAIQDQFVFTHESGVQVTFDGWNITRVAGLLGREPLTLRLDDARTLRIEQGLRSVYEGACSPWQQAGQGYLQVCEGLPPRRITLDEGGNIQALSFTIHPDYPALVLER
jgi:hypothetical protein